MASQLAWAEPDWSYLPQLPVIPGCDFLGWGFDAFYRDTFFALKPQLFNFSYNDNPKGSEKTYKYPLDTVTYAVPDQVYVRTVAKTVTNSYVFTSTDQMRMTIDLTLGVKASISQFEGELKLQFGYVDASQVDKRIIRTLAETQLYQLYLGRRYLSRDFQLAQEELSGFTYNTNKNAFALFLATYGTHFVDSITLGGSVEQRTVIESSNDTELLFLTVAVNGKFEQASGTKVEGNIGFAYQDATIKIQSETTSMSILYGGDPKFTDFVLNAGDPTAAKELYESWKATLLSNPVGVRYRLVDIWQLFENEETQKEVCTAVAASLNFGKSYCEKVTNLLSGYERTGLQVPDTN